MGQARRVGSRKHPTGPMPQYQQEERRFCTCYSANPRQSPKPESSFCPWPTVAVALTVGTGQAGIDWKKRQSGAQDVINGSQDPPGIPLQAGGEYSMAPPETGKQFVWSHSEAMQWKGNTIMSIQTLIPGAPRGPRKSSEAHAENLSKTE
ncbi:hypothetical protein Q8A67_020378 [Cirrhinus molitorella]|uniref:Uncharacterized protein n=1 Tax=Cirrhinus molitorella TaxID=172907 RepID=A0AA88P7L7_9TELE|nr:hypothetical protein Q8A67_020378 [Cirrhinus molitorella]